MILPAYADPATAAIPPVPAGAGTTGETQVQPAVRPDEAPGTAAEVPPEDAAQPEDDAPAPPSRRSVRSAPLDPRNRPSR